MSLADDINLLRQVKMFDDFETEHLRLIAFGSQKMSFSKGHELFQEGQSTDGGYVIISGSIDLFSVQGGEAVHLANFEAGSLLGEMALISINKRVGTAIVKEDCELMKISRVMMRRILNEYPDLAAVLQRKIAASIMDFTKELDKIRI